jgi:hypothetical protein
MQAYISYLSGSIFSEVNFRYHPFHALGWIGTAPGVGAHGTMVYVLQDASRRRNTMKIEILYFDGCPTYLKAEKTLRGVLEEEGVDGGTRLERVMNSIRNGLGMRETEVAREPSRP